MTLDDSISDRYRSFETVCHRLNCVDGIEMISLTLDSEISPIINDSQVECILKNSARISRNNNIILRIVIVVKR